MVDIWLPYGNTEICVRVPTENLLNIIEPKTKLATINAVAEIENALVNPIGTSRLSELAKSGDRIAIVLSDCGKSANDAAISSILKELSPTGIKNENVTVIVAYDPLKNTNDEHLLSEEVESQLRIIWHNPETDEQVRIGETSRGTKVYVNKAFVEAKIKIICGSVKPHFYAGYSGSRDGVLPGVSNLETVQNNMTLALNPKARRGVLESNPVHEDMLEAAYLAKVDSVMNIVQNERGELVKAFAGDMEASFEEATKFADEIYKIPVDARSDIACVGTGGSPFDSNLFEASKVLDSAYEVTKRNGFIVLVAECLQGYGRHEFFQFVSSHKDPDALERNLRKKMSFEGLVAHRFLRTLQRNQVFLVSAIPDYYALESVRMKTARTANEALRYAFAEVEKRGKVSVVTNGNMMIPLVEGGGEETRQ